MQTLDQQLASQSGARSAFTSIYGIASANQVFTNSAYANSLSGVASYINGPLNTSSLTATVWVTQQLKMVGIDSLLTSTPGARAALTTMYGIANQVFTNAVYRDTLSGVASYIVSNPTFTVSDWTTELYKSAALCNAISGQPDINFLRLCIQNDSKSPSNFNGIKPEDQNPVTNSAYRGYLAGVSGSYSYAGDAYINVYIAHLHQIGPVVNNLQSAELLQRLDVQNSVQSSGTTVNGITFTSTMAGSQNNLNTKKVN